MDDPLLLVDPTDGADTLAARLREMAFSVDHVPDGATALHRLGTSPYRCVVTELDLRPVTGLDLCRHVRAEPRTQDLPILFLTTRADEIDRVVAFEVGADDYVLKPCSARELALRVRARLRRAPARPPGPAPIRLGPIEVDPAGHRASLHGQLLPLTARELALLTALARRGGAIVTRESLLQEVWRLPHGAESRTLDTHLRRLREKLGPSGHFLQTIRGVGYRIAVTPQPPARVS